MLCVIEVVLKGLRCCVCVLLHVMSVVYDRDALIGPVVVYVMLHVMLSVMYDGDVF